MANVQFKKGDVVRRTEANAKANGTKEFRHGKDTAVIDRIEQGAFGHTIVWFTHGTNIGVEDIEFATPQALDLRGLLKALYDEEEVVSIDPSDNSVTDTYDTLEGLEDLIYSEIEENTFYLKADWNAYKARIEAEAKAQDLTFEEAVKLLAQGVAVVSFDSDGDEVDTYSTIEDLAQLAGFEIDAVWRKA